MPKIVLPGLIDPHVHLRDPGLTQKEDFYTGTMAAVAGGFTTIIDMPNNLKLIDSEQLLNEKTKIAKKKIICDVGFHFGSLGNNIEQFKKVQDKVIGLKLYLSQTTGGFVHPKEKLERTFKAWPKNKVILVHAEDQTLDFVIKLMKKTGNKVHVCHVGKEEELKKIIKAKEEGSRITCGVTPHYLFLTKHDVKRLGSFGKMKPPLGTKKDQEFIWKNLRYVDLVESDHAPHTVEEKQSNNPPFGVPGLETTLSLLLNAVNEKRLDLNEVIRLCFEGPKTVFNLKVNLSNKIEVDLDSQFTIQNSQLHTKCGWSPFAGMKVKGKVQKVYLRGKKVFENGQIFAKSGSGHLLFPEW